MPKPLLRFIGWKTVERQRDCLTGNIMVTTAGELEKSNNVKKILLAYTEQDREICEHKLYQDPRIATPAENKTIPSWNSNPVTA